METWLIHVLMFSAGVLSTLGVSLIYNTYKLRKMGQQSTIQNSDSLKRLNELNDILAEKEHALLTADAKFRALFEHAPILIICLDKNGIVDLWNKECFKVLGYKNDEIIGTKNVLELFYSAQEAKAVWKDIQKATGKFKEYSTRTKSGRTLRMAWANMLLPNNTIISIGYVLKKIQKGYTPPKKRKSATKSAGIEPGTRIRSRRK